MLPAYAGMIHVPNAGTPRQLSVLPAYAGMILQLRHGKGPRHECSPRTRG